MSASSDAPQRPGAAGDVWGGLASMLVALPSSIAFGVAIYSPLGPGAAASGALAIRLRRTDGELRALEEA